MIKKISLLALYELPFVVGYWFLFVFLQDANAGAGSVIGFAALLLFTWLVLGLRLGLRILKAPRLQSGEKMAWMYSLLLTYPLAVLAFFLTHVLTGNMEA